MVALAGNSAHLSDVGGRGTSEGTDIFEEGLRIPPLKLYKGGEANADLFDVIQANSRAPEDVIGDLRAQKLANEVVARRLPELLGEYGLEDVRGLSGQIQANTEAAMREAIERLPDGELSAGLDIDGYDDPLRLEVTIRIRGSEITIDYAGTSAQIDRGINCPLNLTYAESVFPIMAALLPDVPSAEGALRPIHVIAPVGTIVNPAFPAPVRSRVVVVHNVHAAIFRALQPLVPEHLPEGRIQAHSGCIWGIYLWGAAPGPGVRGLMDVGERWVVQYIFSGGKGATGVRDGDNCLSFPSNVANIPVEYLENRSPLLFEMKELIADSGGAGRFRGGLGQRVVIRSLSDRPMVFAPISTDRIRFAPIGLLGGHPGRAGRMVLNEIETLSSRNHTILKEGDRILLETPGGGGIGDPRTRDPVLVGARHRIGPGISRGRTRALSILGHRQ